MYKTIRTNLAEGVLTVYLNRPVKMNAYTEEMCEELIEVYKEANENNEVRVIIVTGEGRAFCAGMDLSEGGSTFSSNEEMEDYRDSGGRISLQVYKSKKPIIAAINGPAVGIGLTMTLPMDIRIVKKDAKIGFVFAKRGIGPEAASGWFLSRLVGVGKALEWMYTGRYIPTDEALNHGLVQYVDEQPLEKAYEIAKMIAQETAVTSNSFTRLLIWKMSGQEHPYASHLAESKFLYWAGKNADAKEGIQAFLEKRAAKFPLNSHDVPDCFNKGEEHK
ncbi:enoyl-CoA hydratase-related protein [Alkalihalophilus pseudofirmus]|uniref:enoyl-CoA hydratase-related protein n=1 Tax=Alkalihalophilus pseudofirmus TaxID=79885 RepID=UPI00259BD968|nr:enoyl-CoA hydratase-related protein [Alkalihalophilus pseudofirmus]WEG15187.1 enoyl-CoA hydratase-related protein [Alkalihalophilus pseudofirmus]